MSNDDLALIKDKLTKLELDLRDIKSEMKTYKLIITTLICVIAVLVGKGGDIGAIFSQLNS